MKYRNYQQNHNCKGHGMQGKCQILFELQFFGLSILLKLEEDFLNYLILLILLGIGKNLIKQNKKKNHIDK
jgi:hypothetical protein